MDIRKRYDLKQQAGDALAGAAYAPRKLFFLHTAVSLGLSLLLAVLDSLLTGAMAPTGGLGGMQTRAILSTAQSLLQIVNSFALPFWQMGLVFVCLQLIRRQANGPQGLLEGFRRFGPVLRTLLIKALLLIAVCFLCSYISAIVFMLLPASQTMLDVLAPVAEVADPAAMEQLLADEATLAQLMPSLSVLIGLIAVITLAVYIPLSYRMMMTDFVIMDRPETGAFGALRESFRLTRGNCFALFRLDLSFWWFYALDGVILLIYHLDWLLPSVGIALPVAADVAFWLCYGLYFLLRLALFTFVAPKVQTTYAAAYEALQPKQ